MRYLDSDKMLVKKATKNNNGYDTEFILNELGFSFNMYDKQSFSGYYTKCYSNNNGNYGCLLVDSNHPERDKIFFEYDASGIPVSIIVFGKTIDIVEYIPERYGTGIIELNDRKHHVGTMFYYNAESRRKRSTEDGVSPTLTLPVYTNNPFEKIKRVKAWSSDLRLENLKGNPVFRKKKNNNL